MKKIILLFVFVILIFGVKQVFSLNSSSILKEVQAKYTRFEEEITDMTILQEMKMNISSGTITQDVKTFKKDEKFRMEIIMQMPQTQETPSQWMGEMKTIVIFDGNDLWMASPFTGKTKLSNEEERLYGIEKNWWESISDKAEITGTEDIGGKECYVLTVKEGIRSPFTRMWLEKEKLVLVKAEGKMGEKEKMTWINSDFRKLKGDWEWPYKTEIYFDGKLNSITVVKSIEINKGLQEDLFDLGKIETKGLTAEEIVNWIAGPEQGGGKNE